MTEQYTPTTEEVREVWEYHLSEGMASEAVKYDANWDTDRLLAQFDRWLAKRDAEVAAKALEDAARAFDGGTISLDVFSNEVEKSYWRVANEQRSILVDSLRARAAEYRKAVKS